MFRFPVRKERDFYPISLLYVIFLLALQLRSTIISNPSLVSDTHTLNVELQVFRTVFWVPTNTMCKAIPLGERGQGVESMWDMRKELEQSGIPWWRKAGEKGKKLHNLQSNRMFFCGQLCKLPPQYWYFD